MKKKILSISLLLLLTVSIILTGCTGGSKTPSLSQEAENNNNQEEVDKSFEDVKDAGKIVVGLDDSFPPMGFKNESGEIVGFDIDLANEVAKKLGVEAEFKAIDWASKELELKSKKIDMIWNGFTITEERKEQVAFTKPYIEQKQLIVVTKESDIKSKSDLAGKVIGLQSGSSSYNALQKDEATLESIKDIVEYSDNNEVLMDLAIGRTEAAVVDEVVSRYYIAKKPDQYVILEENFGFEDFGVGLRKEDKALLAEINKALDELKEDGTTTKISEEWFGQDIVK